MQIHYNFFCNESLMCLSGESGGVHYPEIVFKESFMFLPTGCIVLQAIALEFISNDEKLDK